ncbi:hypothetical protein [Micromonospora sp. KLBMP9576]|uniref:hypothetical protein n=1 Tax=Micromonospora sp. KLBMP9576 TaxID=3424769 RepID=UPI003D8B537B
MGTTPADMAMMNVRLPAGADGGSVPAGPFTVLARSLSSGAPPAADRPDDRLGGYRPVVRELLRDLGGAHGARYAALWLPGTGDARWTPVVAWQAPGRAPAVTAPARVDDPELLLTLPGVAAAVDVTDGGVRYGVLVLADREQPGHRPAPVTLLGETALCIGLLLRLARSRAAEAAARDRADRALRQADMVRLELSAVQAVERDRLATAVTATPGRQIQVLLAHTRALADALADDPAEAAPIAATIRARLQELIEGFRAVVRGVYPQVLRGSGVAAALAEVVASLPVPVVFHGQLGRRQGWEIESSLYQATASAVTALSVGGAGPVGVELSREGDVLVIRARRAEADAVRVATLLRHDSRRLAALGGRLTVGRAPERATTVVDIRLPERLGADWPKPAHPATPAPPDPPDPPDPSAGDAVAGVPVRRLLGRLAGRRDASAYGVPVRAALERQDHSARVLVLGAQAAQLVRVLCALPEEPGWTPPAALDAVPTCYEHGPHRRITLEPVRGAPPWRPVRIPDWSGTAWPDVAAGLHRLLVETPADALRGLRLLPCRDRVDVGLAVRLRRWSDEAHGLPDAVLLALGGPASAAESEFLTVLRGPGRGDEFAPVVVCAMREGTAASRGSREWLGAMSDAVVDWHPAAGGGHGAAEALRTRLPASTGVLAARWALRALLACQAAGQVDDEIAHAVEAAAAGAYQVAELDLSQALWGRRIRLPRGHDEALRLLGAHEPDVRSRVGLAGDADAGQVRRAVGRALAFWRAQSLSPGAGPEARGAYALLVRTCERLLTGGG